MISVPNKLISNKPLDTGRNHGISLQIAQEAIKIITAVTYDLAIAKFAVQINKKIPSIWQYIYCTLFFFHIEMA